jgi:hypothetical protein
MSGLSILAVIFWLHLQKLGESFNESSGHTVDIISRAKEEHILHSSDFSQ